MDRQQALAPRQFRWPGLPPGYETTDRHGAPETLGRHGTHDAAEWAEHTTPDGWHHMTRTAAPGGQDSGGPDRRTAAAALELRRRQLGLLLLTGG